MRQLKVYDFLNGSGNYWRGHGFDVVTSLGKADILCLNGGADIGTEIYGEVPIGGDGTYYDSPRRKTRRDELEIEQYHLAKQQGKFIFGICRGAQLITCLEGGSLWQHVTKHYGDHPITDVFTNENYRTTSIHHQMMRPPENVPHQVIAVTSLSDYKVSERDEWRKYLSKDDHSIDPEIVWYPDSRALCVQGHPEYASKSDFASYCTRLVKHLWEDPVWPPQTSTSSVAV